MASSQVDPGVRKRWPRLAATLDRIAAERASTSPAIRGPFTDAQVQDALKHNFALGWARLPARYKFIINWFDSEPV